MFSIRARSQSLDLQAGDKDVESDARRVAQLAPGEAIENSAQIARAAFTTVYMGTVNSSNATRDRARRLAEEIGADHLDVKVDTAIDAMAQLFAVITGRTPRFKV